MRDDYEQIKNDYQSIQSFLTGIAKGLEDNLIELTEDISHIDRITCRVKTQKSFLDKVLKSKDGIFKYQVPIKEIQDMIGARIVVYYKSDVEVIAEKVKGWFNLVEKNVLVPDDVSKFGYEGTHFICFIPSFIFSGYKQNLLIPNFFELQIKTLYQHAWSQANHGLGYKPGSSLSWEQERKLAFIAAQSWGADNLLSELSV